MRGTGGREWLAWGDSRIVDHGARRELSTKGALLESLDILIAETVKFADRSRTTTTGEVNDLKNLARYCLADLGPDAQDELRAIGSLEFPGTSEPISKESEERFYGLLDQLRRVLERVRSKIEIGQPVGPNVGQKGPRNSKRIRSGNAQLIRNVPYSKADKKLYELIDEANLSSLTDAKLWSVFRSAFQNRWPGRSPAAFRCSIYRIRRNHGIPAPKRTA